MSMSISYSHFKSTKWWFRYDEAEEHEVASGLHMEIIFGLTLKRQDSENITDPIYPTFSILSDAVSPESTNLKTHSKEVN